MGGYYRKGIPSGFQEIMMSDCPILQGKKQTPRAQDLEKQSLEAEVGPRHDLFLCCPLVEERGTAASSEAPPKGSGSTDDVLIYFPPSQASSHPPLPCDTILSPFPNLEKPQGQWTPTFSCPRLAPLGRDT